MLTLAMLGAAFSTTMLALSGAPVPLPSEGVTTHSMVSLLTNPLLRLALLPALLYYVGIYMQVHCRSLRLGLKPLGSDAVKPLRETLAWARRFSR